MMKYLAFIVLIAFTACSHDKMSTKEIGERVTKIQKEMLARKDLPAPLKRQGEEYETSPISHSYFYKTTRRVDSLIDTVAVNLYIDEKDTAGGIQVVECYPWHMKDSLNEKKGEGMIYTYTVDKNGIIDIAQYFPPTSKERTITYDSTGNMYQETRPMTFEINLHPWKGDSIVKPSAKTKEFYNSKIITILDELERYLFNK